MNAVEELVKRVVAGDLAAYETFVKRFQRLVGHIVFRMVDNQADREDIAQDVFVKIYQNLPGFQFECKVSTWIGKITFNTCANYLAKKKTPLLGDLGPKEATADDFTDDRARPDEMVEANDISSHLRREIAGLPVVYRTVLTFYHLEEMTYGEIARIMDLPMNTVKSHLFRARKALKERLMSKFLLEDLCR
ncbi:MAG: sigma-70 family RNA polymerase sigma factor [candidate division Zixibacteria bacterium]|nr:sigma-70 family RNA polymerase sigma factor [candidate division Zixibacteria bacterium]